MNSFLIVEQDKNTHAELGQKFSLEKGVDALDITVIETVSKKDEEKTAKKGIALIRQVISTASLKPIRGQKKSVVLLNADTLSIPAQNALLKTLEEPPVDTFFILTAENENMLLETIRSRCQIIKKRVKEDALEDYVENNYSLAHAEELSKDKAKALEYLAHQIKQLQRQLRIQKGDERQLLAENIELFQNAHFIAKTTNVNLRLLLENLFLACRAV